MSNGLVWRAAQDRLRQQMSRAQFETWLGGTWLTMAEDGATVLAVRTTFARELLETRFRDRIESAITSVTGQPCTLRITVATALPDGEMAAGEPSPAMPRQTGQRSNLHRGPNHSKPLPAGPTLFGAPSADAEGETSTDSPEPSQPREAVRRGPPTGPLRKRMPGQVGGAALGERVRAALDRARAATPEVTRSAKGWPAGVPGMPEEVSDDASGTVNGQRGDESDLSQLGHKDGLASMNGQGSPHRDRAANELEKLDVDDLPDEPTRPVAQPGAQNYPLVTPGPRLNARYTFSTFIVGSGNQLAHAASQAVAEAPGMAYNPLFLYGGVGLGKTHLLHAIGHTALSQNLVVLYVSSETFTNEIVNAIRYRTTEEFRAKYRSVDVLLVDDIQFIAGKESTEDEFFHTFNALYDENKQIVMCSDRPPKAIVSLEERLRSRFEWGLIADIQPPDLETRIAILQAKADLPGRSVPDDVITFIATRVQSNIRELEGTFNRLLAFSQLQGLPLNLETAKSALANLATDARPRKVDISQVLEAVAEYYHISVEDIRGKARDKHIIVPRHVAMYLMRQETDASLLEIGQALGGRDHSTVLHACDKIGREINENTALRKEVLAIRQEILG